MFMTCLQHATSNKDSLRPTCKTTKKREEYKYISKTNQKKKKPIIIEPYSGLVMENTFPVFQFFQFPHFVGLQAVSS